MSQEKIWYQDPFHFIDEKTFAKFFPTKNMTFTQQLNALLRFAIYFAIVVFIFRMRVDIFIVPVIVAGLTFFLYYFDKNASAKDKFEMQSKNYMLNKKDGTVCLGPSKSNPFMNVLVTDIYDNPSRPKACDLTDKTVTKQARRFFDYNLYRDVDDIFHKNASDRQFYTTASTTIPNDAESFAEWCYGSGPTCKEGNGTKCYNNLYRQVKN